MSVPLRLLLVLLLASAVGSVWLVEPESDAGPTGWYRFEAETGEAEWWCLDPSGRLAAFYFHYPSEDEPNEPIIVMSGRWSIAGVSIRWSIDDPHVDFFAGYPETWWDPQGDRIGSRLDGRTSWMQRPPELPAWATEVDADGSAPDWSFVPDADPWWTRVR